MGWESGGAEGWVDHRRRPGNLGDGKGAVGHIFDTARHRWLGNGIGRGFALPDPIYFARGGPRDRALLLD